jgi:hypothetical protein
MQRHRHRFGNAVAEKVYTDGHGRPTGPWTPWGRADGVREIQRGVRWVNTPGHGGLGVAAGVAEKLLSPAARKLSDFDHGYHWYEEDIACSIPFYEHPEWSAALGIKSTTEDEAARIREYFPKYFELRESGVTLKPRPRVGMSIEMVRDMPFSTSTLAAGTRGVIMKITSATITFMTPDGQRFKLPTSYYMSDAMIRVVGG